MTDDRLVVSVDLGGTHLRVGCVDASGNVIYKIKVPAEARSGSDRVLEKVYQSIEQIRREAVGERSIVGVALGFPGIVHPEKGIVYQSPHFPDWKNLDLLSFFKSRIQETIIIDNDANLAALGEAWKGAGQRKKNFIMITLGTGMGGGLVLNRQVWHGDRGFAGEIGHICVDIDGPPCGCGSHGCLETYASASAIGTLIEKVDDERGLERLLEKSGLTRGRLSFQFFYEQAMDGDIFANAIFKKFGFYLGVGIATMVNTLGMETIIIGGGVSEALKFFIQPALKEIRERTYQEVADKVQIEAGQLGDEAGLVGGAAAFFTRPS